MVERGININICSHSKGGVIRVYVLGSVWRAAARQAGKGKGSCWGSIALAPAPPVIFTRPFKDETGLYFS